MKFATIFSILALFICQRSNAQTTNHTSEASARAHYVAKDVKFTALNIDYGLGHVLMSEQPTLYNVQLPVEDRSSFKKSQPADAESLGLQVWFLRTDGTAIPQQKLGEIRVDNQFFMMYAFDKGSANELAGIVVRAKGKLYVQEIGADKK